MTLRLTILCARIPNRFYLTIESESLPAKNEFPPLDSS